MTPEDVSGLLTGLKSLVERGSSDAAAVLAQVLAHLAADDSNAQVTPVDITNVLDTNDCSTARTNVAR